MMTAPKDVDIVWRADFRYKAFYVPELRVATLVSSNTQDTVQGLRIGENLVLVCDASGQFCDLEFAMEPAKRRPIRPPSDIESSAATISVSLQRGADVVWDLDGEQLQIAISGRNADHYVRLEGTSLLIGFSTRRELSLLTISRVIADPTGAAEAAWLDELGMDK